MTGHPAISRHLSWRVVGAGMGVLCLSLFAAMETPAQEASPDVAEAARQERARKSAQGQNTIRAEAHVYTNEDLQRSHILVEEDSARVALQKRNPAPTSAADASVVAMARTVPVGDATNGAAGESLGAVARRYRQEKVARAANQASGISAASRFKLDIAPNALAEIAPSVAPRIAPSVPPRVAPSVQAFTTTTSTARTPHSGSTAKTVAGGILRRRDPFSRTAVRLPLELVSAANLLPALPTLARPVAPKAIVPRSTGTNPVRASGPACAIAPVVAVKPLGGKLVVPAPSPPVSGVAGTVTIRAGDSLWRLSRRYWGSGARWREWLARNSGLSDPRSLRVGAVLVVPRREDGSAPLAASVRQAATQTIVVRRGDSLWKIAAERYGDGTRWSCLALANPGIHDAKVIYPGRILTLPAACGDGVSNLSANSAIAH